MVSRLSGISILAAASLTAVLGAPTLAMASAHYMMEQEAALHATEGGVDDAWDTANNPGFWDPGQAYNYDFSQLPKSGRMKGHQPWSDIYWPTNQGGIAQRWNNNLRSGFDYRILSESDIRSMSRDALARLSPAEKYDIYMGRFDFPTVRELRGSLSKSAPYWAGICHGWSPAAINHAEPAPVLAKGPSGIEVPFGSGDVKGLIDNYYADNEHQYFLGVVCHSGGSGGIFRKIRGAFDHRGCDDVNAGALHVILANELGVAGRGFVADVDRKGEVWNQPVYGFESQAVSENRRISSDSASGTVREINVHTRMFYADELDNELWQPVVGTAQYKEGIEEYDYTLELNSANQIIGGHWISWKRPDFLWTKNKRQFTGYWSGLNGIYRPADPNAGT